MNTTGGRPRDVETTPSVEPVIRRRRQRQGAHPIHTLTAHNVRDLLVKTTTHAFPYTCIDGKQTTQDDGTVGERLHCDGLHPKWAINSNVKGLQCIQSFVVTSLGALLARCKLDRASFFAGGSGQFPE